MRRSDRMAILYNLTSREPLRDERRDDDVSGIDAIDAIARETGKTVPQIAINWLLQRPTVANVIIGARTEEQLRQNLGALGWTLSAEQIARLDETTAVTPAYPYWHQAQFSIRNPSPVS